MTESARFEHRGWIFESNSGPIATSGELEILANRLSSSARGVPPAGAIEGPNDGLAPASEFRAPLPEQIFSRNSLIVRHEESGFTLCFDAEGALKEWHKAQTGPPDRPTPTHHHPQARGARQLRESRGT